MVFSSPIFLLLFLPIVLVGYLLAPRSARNVFLLLASLFFYFWGEHFYIFVMLGSIGANYVFGFLIHIAKTSRQAKWALALGVATNLTLLVVYKYFNFFIFNINELLSLLDWPLIRPIRDHLPIGISFFTFQSMSYIIDVYRKDAPVQKNPLNLALYISLFPQLIAGPIVRYNHIADQLTRRFSNLDGVAYGIRRFIVGLAKKVLIANTLAFPVDRIFQIPGDELTFTLAWLGTIGYTLQLYYDFSGYSDMAIGLGKIFGFDFPENFNYPYIARSIREFWQRWHITLSTWFRDYLYFPMGGSRGSEVRTYFNLMTVFLLCGFWHGAGWTFIIWGACHGFFLSLERMGLERMIQRLGRPAGHIYMLLVFMLSLTVFRCEDLAYSGDFLKAMLSGGEGDGIKHNASLYLNRNVWIALVIGILGSMPTVPYLKAKFENYLNGLRQKVQMGLSSLVYSVELFWLLGIFVLSLSFMAADTYNPFIYFRF